MASLISHPALPLAIYLALKKRISRRLLWLCLVLTLLPDADVIAFKFGIPYHSQWGHRGFTHSLTFALVTGLICMFFSPKLESSRKTVFWMSFLSTLSHPLFDAFTNGGLGVAFLWPFSNERYFLPFHPVQVSPIGVRGFLSFRGLIVVASEILWIWLPCLSLSYLVRKVLTRHT